MDACGSATSTERDTFRFGNPLTGVSRNATYRRDVTATEANADSIWSVLVQPCATASGRESPADARALSSPLTALARTRTAHRELRALNVVSVDRLEVLLYFWEHPGICDVAHEAARRSRAVFGDEASLLLDVYTDPETCYRFLRLRIRVETYDKAFADTLFQLQTECPSFDRDGNTLLLTSDFA